MNDETKKQRSTQIVWIFLVLAVCSTWTAFGEEIHYYCGDTNSSSTTFIPSLKLNNNTGSPVLWSILEIRYYFTKDDTTSTYRFICESAPVEQGLQASQVSGTFINISGSDYYLKITFTSSASIPANTLTGVLNIKVYIDNSQTRNQGNDYSFNAGYTSYAAWNQITLYKSSVLTWGVVPGDIGGGEDPTAEPATPEPTAAATSEPVTLEPTSAPTADPATLEPTSASAETAAPTETPAPTAVPTATPAGVTAEPTSPPGITDAPTSPPSITADPTTAPGSSQYIWVEAESCAAYWPQILSSDSYADWSTSDCASGEIYLAVNGYNSTDVEPEAQPSPTGPGKININFTTSTTGTYRVWARVKTPDSSSDSWWVKMDTGAWTKWDNVGPYSVWSWAITGDYTLAAGSHTLIYGYCEDGALLDKILITNDSLYSPIELGDPIPTPSGSNTYSSSVVTTNGNLQVIGKNLCNQSGTPIQLRGVCTHGPQWYPIVTNYTIPNLAQTWGIDIVRIAMYVEDFKDGGFWNGYLAHRDEMKQQMKGYIDDAISAGIYVIIDWHIHEDPVNFTTPAMQSAGTNAITEASTFFAEMATTYGGYPNVLFDINNEPVYTDWNIIRSFADTIIPIIRNNDPDGYDNIIIVGTPSWCQEPDIAAANQLTGYTNLLYAVHFYASAHTQAYRDKVTTALNLNLPMIASEWSACSYDVSILDSYTEAESWLTLLNANNISYTFWSFCNRDDKSAVLKPGVSMQGPWADSDLTEQGLWVKGKM